MEGWKSQGIFHLFTMFLLLVIGFVDPERNYCEDEKENSGNM